MPEPIVNFVTAAGQKRAWLVFN